MRQIAVDQDIVSLTEFRGNLTGNIESLKKTHRPIVVTQNGKGSMVAMSVEAYQGLIDEVENHKNMVLSLSEILRGKTKDLDTAFDEIITRLPK